jgi:Major royal jelly protein
MYPYPSHGTHTISGESFELMDGIFGMAVDKNKNDANRLLYFHALASEVENSVPVKTLNNRTAWENDENSYASEFKIIGPRGSAAAASVIDSNGNLFFGMNNVNALACWDTTKRPLTHKAVKVLIRDDDKLQFAAGMKIIRNSENEDELWIMTNRFQVMFFCRLCKKKTFLIISNIFAKTNSN